MNGVCCLLSVKKTIFKTSNTRLLYGLTVFSFHVLYAKLKGSIFSFDDFVVYLLHFNKEHNEAGCLCCLVLFSIPLIDCSFVEQSDINPLRYKSLHC